MSESDLSDSQGVGSTGVPFVNVPVVRADRVGVGDVVMVRGSWREVIRTSLSTDGSLVKLQYGDDSRDWWPVAQEVLCRVG